MVAPSVVNHPAPARNPVEFEVPPRSAAPVAVPLEFAHFTQGQKRRRLSLATVASLGVLAIGGLGFAAYWTSRPPQRKATVAALAPSAVLPAPVPSAEPAAPDASTQADAAAPPAEAAEAAEVAKPAARERSAAPAAARAASSRREEARAATARKAEPYRPEPAEAVSEATTSADIEGAAPPRAEDAAKKAEAAATVGPPFDRETAAQSLADAALRAVTCRMLGGPTGSGQATVTFAPSGQVSGASVGGDFAGTVVGACVVKLFRSVTVPPFAGDPVTVAKRFNVE